MKLALTHYDILYVGRDAPQEVIRATYRALCRKYHPDLNAGASDMNRIMAIINVSYDILSTPSRRQAYDDWLAEQESPHGATASISLDWRRFRLPAIPMRPQLVARTALVISYVKVKAATTHIWQHAGMYATSSLAMLITMAAILSSHDEPVQLELMPLLTSPPLASHELHPVPTSFPQLTLIKAVTDPPDDASAGRYVRPEHAPNGYAWPMKAGYLKNTPVLHNHGNAIVNVENVANTSDVHVKLIALRGLREDSVREFYIPAHGSFILKNLSPGLYDVRYRDLDNGRLARSEEFMIEEGVGVKGTQQVKVMVTLDKIQKNRVDTFGMLEAEF